MTSPSVVAVDVGGTTMKGALVGADGEPLARRDVRTPAGHGGGAVATAVVGLASWLANHPAAAGVVGVAAVTPGRVESGVVRSAANLGWREVHLAGLLAEKLGLPATVDNDVSAAALAEAELAGRADDCLFVALGTGVGAAHVRAGVVAGGATGSAGEIGHVPVYPSGQRCGCGQRGCLEAYASAAGLVRRYREFQPDLVGDAADVVARLGSDPAADLVWNEAIDALALALASATLLLDPALVVLGGGLAGAGPVLLDPLRARLATRLAWRPAPRVELSVLGGDAGWRGAALRAWQSAQHPQVPRAVRDKPEARETPETRYKPETRDERETPGRTA